MTLKAKLERNLCLQVICTLALKQLFEATRKYPTVVYHLHGQTGRFKIWANGYEQNLGLENFIAESHVYHSFVQISSIYRKTAEKA